MKTAIVIGAGFAGLSTASCLAKQGMKVTLIEKNESAGGRARVFRKDGFTFDMGPSWYWMPDVFERYFSLFGKKPSDYFQLERLSPSYRIYFSPGDYMDVPSDMKELEAMFESYEKGSGEKLRKFLKDAQYKYEVGINDLVYRPGLSLMEFADRRVLGGLMKMHLLKSFSSYIRSYFSHPRLLQLLEFPVLFLGAKPEKTPALYSLMNYADMALGTWYPVGGMGKIVEGMERIAKEMGVEILLNTTVEKLETNNGKITAVHTNNGIYKADVIVGSADYHHLDQEVLDKKDRNYSARYWDKRVMAPSSLIFYLGLNKKLKGMLHHTLFFDEDFGQHAKEIYDHPQWPEKPLFYTSCPSVSDPSVAPEGHEAFFILIPVAPGLEDNEEIREKYFNLVIDRFEKLTNQTIREHIVLKRSYAHKDFIHDYNAFKGNAYGLANTLKQTAVLKPRMKSKKISNLYFTGQLTVPGPGVPPTLISGQVAARLIAKETGIPNTI
ncbi:MAG: phytoene desaturase [Flavobacteriales bacterium]|nr:phytoene desaturase [Flavobacteriales bacterium]